MRADRRSQRGIAVILAMLVLAVAMLITVSIAVRWQAELRRTEMLLHGEQALQYVLGAEEWVLQILRRHRQDHADDHFGHDWAIDLPPLPVDGGMVVGRLEDLNGRFNLTNLVNAEGQPSQPHLAQFRRLIQALGVADQIAPAAVIDFIDPDMQVTMPDGAEDAYYLATDPPHRTPNRPLVALSELNLLRDFDPALLPVLAPHIVTLPARTQRARRSSTTSTCRRWATSRRSSKPCPRWRDTR
jgi:general secretion pathway protein K